MRRIAKYWPVALLLLLTAWTSGAGSAVAAPVAIGSTVSLGGRTFGPEDGVVVETQQVELRPGGEPVVVEWPSGSGLITPQATWGSSYATSTETAQLYYTGRAKAAANVYSGKRIVSVCFWYSRGGTRLIPNQCSNARTSGSRWVAGPEVSKGVWDTLDPDAPRTIFNISTMRIGPGVL